MSQPARLYLAASVFSSFDRQRNSEIAERLTDRGYLVYLPQEVRTETGKRPTADVIFKKCVAEIDESDLIVGLVDGSDVDSGTAWELGYAYARTKPIVVLRTDYRSAESGPVNIMIQFSTRVVLVNRPENCVAEGITALVDAIKHILGHT
jgi:nucleoside 2-deoxyribosyltransferase